MSLYQYLEESQKSFHQLLEESQKSFHQLLSQQNSSQMNQEEVRDLMLSFHTNQLQNFHQNPLNAFGKKCFSQTDEDGITLEILKRLKCIEQGTFAEFGVGNGTENNTLILKALGWSGFWVGGEDLAFEIKEDNQTFSYLKNWITRDNILELTHTGMQKIVAKELDVISLDLDGNDIYLVEKLLSDGFLPKLFIVEYNAKFPPAIKWQIDYNPNHTWQNDDYFGASLGSFTDLFKKHHYQLVCCNAFYVRDEFSEAFNDVPKDIDNIYVPPRYYLYRSYGHKNALKTIEKLFV